MALHRQRFNFRGARQAIFGVVATGLAVALACHKEIQNVAAAPRWFYDCPDEYAGVKIRFATGPNGDTTKDSITEVALSEPITDVPEYHDCQRFIDSSGQYGSIYAIFAAFRLDAPRRWEEGAPVATIYTPDGTYDALGIAPGFNCLLLSRAGLLWTATMIKRGQGHQAADCTSVPATGGKPLEVKEQRIISEATFTTEDFPPVARWDWDSLHKKQYIGIQCGAAWCEVGESGFAPSPGYQGPKLSFQPVPGIPFSAAQTERVQRIKGWYDDQRLALTNVTPQQPSDVHGFLIPSPALEMINKRPNPKSYYRSSWVHVGYAVLEDGDYPKWNFTRGSNYIYLCYGAANPRGCRMTIPAKTDRPASKPLDSCEPDPNDHTMRWWAKTVSATGGTSYACVKRTDHGAQLMQINNTPGSSVLYAIAGTARWKFMINDDGTWHGCPTGCCTKQ